MKKISLALLALALTAGVVWASIPGPDGVIHGCYRNSTGDLRAVDSASPGCRNDESTLTWNQQGPAGPQGPPGPSSLAVTVVSASTPLPTQITDTASELQSAVAVCPAGSAVTGGGYNVTGTTNQNDELTVGLQVRIYSNAPTTTPAGWAVKAALANYGSISGLMLNAYALCTPGAMH